MNNNDIFKKLRVALQLRDDQIVEIMELVDFRISKGELGNIFRDTSHEKYVDCGDQILRNFLNGLIIHLRGTKENPKNPKTVLEQNKKQIGLKTIYEDKKKAKPKTNTKSAPKSNAKFNSKKEKPIQIVEKVAYKNGKKPK